jgi:hypothetical protein
MTHRRNDFGQQVISGVDLAIDFATLGEYGLVPRSADGSCRDRTGRRAKPNRRPGWEAPATTRRGACAPDRTQEPLQWRFPRASSRANFRAALARYAG